MTNKTGHFSCLCEINILYLSHQKIKIMENIKKSLENLISITKDCMDYLDYENNQDIKTEDDFYNHLEKSNVETKLRIILATSSKIDVDFYHERFKPYHSILKLYNTLRSDDPYKDKITEYCNVLKQFNELPEDFNQNELDNIQYSSKEKATKIYNKVEKEIKKSVYGNSEEKIRNNNKILKMCLMIVNEVLSITNNKKYWEDVKTELYNINSVENDKYTNSRAVIVDID